MSAYLDFKASERQATVTPSLRTPTGRRLTTIANAAIGLAAEIGVVDDADGVAIIHGAMPARSKFLKGWWTP